MPVTVVVAGAVMVAGAVGEACGAGPQLGSPTAAAADHRLPSRSG